MDIRVCMATTAGLAPSGHAGTHMEENKILKVSDKASNAAKEYNIKHSLCSNQWEFPSSPKMQTLAWGSSPPKRTGSTKVCNLTATDVDKVDGPGMDTRVCMATVAAGLARTLVHYAWLMVAAGCGCTYTCGRIERLRPFRLEQDSDEVHSNIELRMVAMNGITVKRKPKIHYRRAPIATQSSAQTFQPLVDTKPPLEHL